MGDLVWWALRSRRAAETKCLPVEGIEGSRHQDRPLTPLEEHETMTMEEQAHTLEASYGQYHRVMTQSWHTAEDRQEARQTLKLHVEAAEHTLRLPLTRETAHARSKLLLWLEMARGLLQELPQP